MTEKEMFLQTKEREFQTTMKILKAFPVERLEYRPHEKSSSAKKLAWTFAMEEGIIEMASKGKIDFSAPMPSPPDTMAEILAGCEQAHKKSLGIVKNISDDDFNSTIQFPVGPGKMAPFRKADVCWTTLMDAVHHRGQMSVYLRLVGAKVPSIYGPTADEPWM
jgi:uncharacterized damage-inducible protein DinB